MTERRADPRHRAVQLGRVLRIVSGESAPPGIAVAEDVSAGGALVLASVKLRPGDTVVLEPSPSHPLAGWLLLFRVLRCVERSAGGYRLAGLFVPRLTDAEARALAGA